nr:hypothetical protein CFP56_01944 [Quercus suber]
MRIQCGGSPQVQSSENSSRDETRPSDDGYLAQTDTFVNLTIGSIGFAVEDIMAIDKSLTDFVTVGETAFEEFQL